VFRFVIDLLGYFVTENMISIDGKILRIIEKLQKYLRLYNKFLVFPSNTPGFFIYSTVLYWLHVSTFLHGHHQAIYSKNTDL
jgi:hypothetical protein